MLNIQRIIIIINNEKYNYKKKTIKMLEENLQALNKIQKHHKCLCVQSVGKYASHKKEKVEKI